MFGVTDTIKNYIIIALVIALGVVGAAAWLKITYLEAANTTLEANNTALTSENNILRDNLAVAESVNRRFEVTLTTQNKEIMRLGQEAEARRIIAADAVSKARAETAKWKHLYDALLSAPPASADECTATDQRLNGYFQLRQGEKQ